MACRDPVNTRMYGSLRPLHHLEHLQWKSGIKRTFKGYKITPLPLLVQGLRALLSPAALCLLTPTPYSTIDQ